jgi:4-hydroxyphenylpyruvate dioxygenase-like putative hemolysin
VPCAFLELIERHEGFRGFLGQNAKGIFESTKMRR